MKGLILDDMNSSSLERDDIDLGNSGHNLVMRVGEEGVQASSIVVWCLSNEVSSCLEMSWSMTGSRTPDTLEQCALQFFRISLDKSKGSLKVMVYRYLKYYHNY